MTRKKSRKTRSFSQSQNPRKPQNPKKMADEEEQHQQHQDEEEQEEQQQHHENQHQDDEEQEQEHEEAESQPMRISPSAHDSIPVVSRKGGKRKKPTRRQRDAVQKKLRLLKENLQPIPFTPIKALDLSKHENLFKTLGLWEFARLEFDRDVRSDLLALLIANYDAGSRCSYVKDHRINVNRTDLGRALKLPVKKEKSDSDQESFSEESIGVVFEFMSNYMLLHEDTWMMPEEILASERLVKDGQPQKVDWAGLIWFMVERELMQAPESGSCYYTSHLLYLVKSQKPDIFKEEDVEEVSVEEDEDAAPAVTKTTVSLDAFQEHDLENQNIELSLGQENSIRDNAGEEVNDMKFQECKEEEPGQWLVNEKSIGGVDHSLRHCNLNVFGNSECEPVDKEAEDERFEQSMKLAKLERLESADLIQTMETTNVSYGMAANLIDPSSSEFLSPRADLHKSILLNSGGLSMFGNACKREINDEDDVRHMSHNDHNRKMKNDGSWDHTPEGFVMCIEQAQSWLNKARAMQEEKDEAYMRTQVHLDYLATELEQRDSIIHSMEKSLLEERNKEQVEVYRLGHELCVMTQLLHGYKKALKETRNAFAEYRQRFEQPDEPIYKDVGGGGVVLSIMELEKQRLEKEEEDRKLCFAIEEKVKTFEQDWFGKFDSHLNLVDLLEKRLLKIVKEVGLLKENSKTEHLTT